MPELTPTTLGSTGGLRLEVKGAAELARQMRELPLKMARKVLNTALRKAAKPMLQTARNLAPVATERTNRVNPGLIKRSLSIRSMKKTTEWQRGITIGVRTLAGRKRRVASATRKFMRLRGVSLSPSYMDPYYWYFWEHGWNVSGRWRGHGMSRASWRASRRGHVPFIQKKFLEPAFDRHHAQFLQDFTKEIEARLRSPDIWK